MFCSFGARSTTFEGTDGTLYLGVGGGWTYNWLGDGDSSEEINQYAGELQFAWNVVSLQGELLLGQHGFANASVTDYTQVGWYGTAATYIPAPWLKDHVQVVARLGQSEPDDQMVGDPAGQVQPATREITGGANLYWMGAPRPFHDVKLQLAYSHFQELEGVDFLNDRLTAAATARF